MYPYNDENDSRTEKGSGWYSDGQDASENSAPAGDVPQSGDGSYRIDKPRQDSSYYQDANYTPQSEATGPQSYYVPNTKDSGEKKEKAHRKGGLTASKIVAICLCCALLGGAAGGGLVYAFSPVAEAEPASTSPITQVTATPAPAETQGVSPSGVLTGNEIYQLACQQVVGVTTEITTTNWFGQMVSGAVSGSGFILTADGYIMTNYHVIEEAYTGGYDVSVMLHDGTTYAAEIVGFERNNDIAILKIDAENLSAATLGSSGDLNVGDTVYAVGNPLGELAYSMTSGIVSATDRVIATDVSTSINMFQFDAAVNEGNSGGPLYDAYGHVIGVVTAKTGDSASTAGTEGLNFAIPIDDAARIANNIIEQAETGVSDTLGNAYLGVTVQDVQVIMSQYYGFPSGAYVASVEEGGAAQAAGLKIGDVITELDGFSISGRDDLSNELNFHSAGETADIVVYRSGEYLTLSVTFGERPAEDPNAQSTPAQGSDYPNSFDFGWGNYLG